MAAPKTRDRILEAALRLFNDEGLPAVSTHRVAAELGISPGNLHYHFKTKRLIVAWLFRRYEDRLEPCLAAAGAILHYFKETIRAPLVHFTKLIPFRSESILILDDVTRRSLELTRTLRDNGREGSLLSGSIRFIFLNPSTPCSVTHPSSVSALRADPPSPTGGEGKGSPFGVSSRLLHYDGA